MTAEENIENRHDAKKPSPEEMKKLRLRAVILASFLVVGLIAFFYAIIKQSRLEKQIIELQEQIQKRDSLLQQNSQELKVQYERAEQLLKKSVEKSNKMMKSTKNTQKRNKPKKK